MARITASKGQPTTSDLPEVVPLEQQRCARDLPAQATIRNVGTSSKPCCICGDCVKTWLCIQCGDLFCDPCWARQRPHMPGKIVEVPHEKNDEEVVDRIRSIFDFNHHGLNAEEVKVEQMNRLHDDLHSTWFGVDWRKQDSDCPFLHHSNRLMDILHDQVGAPQERFPQMVSFVGQTGAGKSTVIKMLMSQQQATSVVSGKMSYPVPGSVTDNIPTTGNVHLYADPGTYAFSSTPILYADCEGLNGGEGDPKALSASEGRDESKRSGNLIKHKFRRRLSWAKTRETQSREYAVGTLFPRILYTFSDVVVFVLRHEEQRAFQTKVLKQLITWAASSVDKSVNQPKLSHAIIVVNATDSRVDNAQWDPKHATEELLRDYQESVQQVPELQDITSNLSAQNKRVDTAKELLEHFYSSVTVLRIPTKDRYKLLDEQFSKLYRLINENCARSHRHKKQIRMSLNTVRLPQYIGMAFAHFSKKKDEPFNFLEASRRCAPAPRGFGGHILDLIVSLYRIEGSNSGDWLTSILISLSPLIASCIMLAALRDNTQGEYVDLLKFNYREILKNCLMEFCDNWLGCAFVHDKVRCRNAKNFHHKGHQGPSGYVFNGGGYQSPVHFPTLFENWMNQIAADITRHKARNQEKAYGKEEDLIHDLHQEVVQSFYEQATTALEVQLRSPWTCLYCLRRVPESTLPCGHTLCKPCVKSLGTSRDQGVFELDSCPLHPSTLWRQPASIRFKPDEAGVRMLCMDGGGVRGLVELAVLQAIENELGGYVPIQHFFDLVVGTSTGGIIALGLGVKQWRVSECQEIFKKLAKKAFTRRALMKAVAVKSKSWYRTKPIEEVLKASFGDGLLFSGGEENSEGGNSGPIRVAVTATSATEGNPVILANYNTGARRTKVPYYFLRPHRSSLEFKIWEAARATSAAPSYFKYFEKSETRTAYVDGAIYYNCPVRVAEHERKLIWEEVSDWPADILLSLGTGLSSSEVQERGHESKRKYFDADQHQNTARHGDVDGWRGLFRTIKGMIDDQLDCEKTWEDYCTQAPLPKGAHHDESNRRNFRINLTFPGTKPRLDDVSDLQGLEDEANRLVKSDSVKYEIVEVAHRLVASCFYFQRTKCSAGQKIGSYECTGNIRCRFIEGTQNIKGLGKIMRKFTLGADFVPFFHVQENYGARDEESFQVPIPDATIQRMCDVGSFRMPTDILIEGSRHSSVSRLSLCLQPGHYGSHNDHEDPRIDQSERSLLSISGFPRPLWEVGDLEVPLPSNLRPASGARLSSARTAAGPRNRDKPLPIHGNGQGKPQTWSRLRSLLATRNSSSPQLQEEKGGSDARTSSTTDLMIEKETGG